MRTIPDTGDMKLCDRARPAPSIVGAHMMRTAAVALAALAAIDFLMFDGMYLRFVRQIAHQFLMHLH